jgi:hypothetical protein
LTFSGDNVSKVPKRQIKRRIEEAFPGSFVSFSKYHQMSLYHIFLPLVAEMIIQLVKEGFNVMFWSSTPLEYNLIRLLPFKRFIRHQLRCRKIDYISYNLFEIKGLEQCRPPTESELTRSSCKKKDLELLVKEGKFNQLKNAEVIVTSKDVQKDTIYLEDALNIIYKGCSDRRDIYPMTDFYIEKAKKGIEYFQKCLIQDKCQHEGPKSPFWWIQQFDDKGKELDPNSSIIKALKTY